MSARNGTAFPAILDLGDLTPPKRPVRLVRDGKPVTLDGYVSGRRCPTGIKSRIRSINNEFFAARAAIQAQIVDDVWTDEQTEEHRLAYEVYLRESLMALVPGMTFDEAELMSGDVDDDGPAKKTLRYLEFLQPAAADGEADDENPPEEASPSTTEQSSPDSPPSMARTTGSDSPNA